MHYPLRFQQHFARELLCLLVGHRWKSSWRRRVNFWTLITLDRDQLPYRQRHEGNPFYENSGGWHYRCRRCRLRTRDGAWHPWWKLLYWGVSSGLRDAVWHCRYAPPWNKGKPGEGYAVPPWRWWLVDVAGVPVTILRSILVYLSERRFASHVLVGLACDAEYWMMEQVEPHRMYYRWQPPVDPTNPYEIGLWRTEGDGVFACGEVRAWSYPGQGSAG